MSFQGTATRRLMTEYKQLSQQSLEDSMFTAGPISEDNMFEWEALIQGPDDTPFVSWPVFNLVFTYTNVIFVRKVVYSQLL